MSALPTLVVAALTAAVAAVAAWFLAVLWIDWYRISGFEGGAGYFALSLSLLGLVVGFVLGAVVARTVGGPGTVGVLRAFGAASALVLTLVGVAAAAGRTLAHIAPTFADGEGVMVAVEVRWPATQVASPAGTPGEARLVAQSLGTAVGRGGDATGPLWTADARRVAERWVVPGIVDLHTQHRPYLLSAVVPGTRDTTTRGFVLPLPRAPRTPDARWSAWVEDATPGVPAAERWAVRYRLQPAGRPVRTDVVGPFEIVTTAHGFHHDFPGGGASIGASAAWFAVRHRGTPLTLPLPADDGAPARPAARIDEVAVLGGERPALLVYASADEQRGLFLASEDASGALHTTHVGSGFGLAGTRLLAGPAGIAPDARRVPRGVVDRATFAEPGLFLVEGKVLDTRRLTVHALPMSDSTSGTHRVRLLALSPDERQLVYFAEGDGIAWKAPGALEIVDLAGGRTELRPIDRPRMHYQRSEEVDGAWLARHFAWRTVGNGRATLAERADLVTAPYRGTPPSYGSYSVAPVGPAMREVMVAFLERELGGRRLPPAYPDAPELVVQLRGRVVQVGYWEPELRLRVDADGHRDAKGDDPAGDALVAELARRFDAELATGRHDALFGRE